MSVRPDEARVQEIGRELFERVAAERQAFYSADRWTAALFAWSLAHEEAKLQLFRFVDVLPALDSDRDLVRHLREYFEGRDAPYAGLLHTALGVARVAGRLGDAVVGMMLRETVRRLARRFIAGSTPEEARRAALDARRAGQAFTLDLLGEACLNDVEADAYEARYVELVETLGREAPRWPSAPRLDTAPWGPVPRVNVSVKISALHPWLEPADPEGSAAAVRARLRPILRAARARGAHIHVDMEDRRLRDLTLRIFMELADEAEFRHERNLGIVLQAYLKDAEADARRLIAWARRRENTSNESFLRRGFAEHESPDALLADPEQIRVAPPPRVLQDFESEPHADFTRAAVRDDFAAALAAVHSRLGGDHPLVIDGRRVPTAEFIVSVNPSRAGEVVGRVADAGAAEVDRAVAAAARAFPAWRDAGAEARAEALGRVAVGLRERRYELAAWIVYEAGKPWAEADSDVAEAIDFVEYYRAQARQLQRPQTLGRRRGEVNHYTREGRGVVGVIAPWNFPLAILTGMTSAALATGNTVVMKPAEQTPVIAARP